MIENLLQEIGFSEKETKVYLLLAEAGKSTVQLLARRAGMPRTTAYSVLENLQQRGLVSAEHKHGTTFYVIQQASALLRMVNKEQEALKRKEAKTKELVELIKPYFKSKFFSVPRIQFFEGHMAIENLLYDHTKEWLNAVYQTDWTWWGYQDHTFVEHYREWLEWVWQIKNPQMKIWLLSNQASTPTEKDINVGNRIIKPIAQGNDFNSTVWVAGDFVIMLMTREEPYYAFQLRDAVFAGNMRFVFKLLWNAL
ncbi:MAG: helix-turn-helix domain-containing protein [Oligoflexia bacterium]|nr:helix-turn-helix domain-containing protein [Oligoflexia bacterium]